MAQTPRFGPPPTVGIEVLGEPERGPLFSPTAPVEFRLAGWETGRDGIWLPNCWPGRKKYENVKECRFFARLGWLCRLLTGPRDANFDCFFRADSKLWEFVEKVWGNGRLGKAGNGGRRVGGGLTYIELLKNETHFYPLTLLWGRQLVTFMWSRWVRSPPVRAYYSAVYWPIREPKKATAPVNQGPSEEIIPIDVTLTRAT